MAAVFFASEPSFADRNNALHAAPVLIEQFETVFYSDIHLLSGSSVRVPLAKEDRDSLSQPFFYLTDGLDSLGKNVSGEVFHLSDSVLVGAKDFRPPAGLGPVRSQRCYVVVLKNDNTLEFRKYFKESPSASAMGSPVWSWSAKTGEFGELDSRLSSFYATQLGHSYLLVSNSVEALQAVAERLLSPNNDSKITNDVCDWASMNGYPFWGYRLYRHSDKTSDGVSYAPPDARSLCFFVDIRKKTAVLRLVGSPTAKDALAIHAGKIPEFRPYQAGAWETRIPLHGNDLTWERLFDIRVFFGFAVVL